MGSDSSGRVGSRDRHDAVIATVAADRSYAIAISSDASALLGRLELAQRRPITSGTSAAEVQRAFDAVCHEVPRHVTVRFDDVASTPRATCIVDAADARRPIHSTCSG